MLTGIRRPGSATDRFMPNTARRAFAVVFDLEFTAWQGSMASRWSRPGERTEVVQIGAVKLDARTLAVVDEFDILVQPRLNPVLSDYLVELTAITNGALAARGVDFVVAYRAFLDFAGGAPLWAYGRDDLIFEDNLKLYGWRGAFRAPRYHNVIPWFVAHGVELSGKRASDVPEAVGLAFEGHKHDALADARGVARAIAALIARGAPNPFLEETTA
jgi:DNA polymerase III epsilon subunit-like protein